MKEAKYAGTQTEKNLMAAFAGESEARNKYTYLRPKRKRKATSRSRRCSSKPLTTRRNMLSCGSKN